MTDPNADDLKTEMLTECIMRMETRGKPENKSGHQLALDVDSIIDICTRKLRSHPGHPKALITRATAYMKTGEYEAALADCSLLLTKIPEHIQAHFIRGVALDMLSRSPEAVDEFTRVLKLDPGHANAAFSRAASLIKIGQHSAALDDYVQGLELDSKRNLVHRKTLSVSTYCSLTGSATTSPLRNGFSTSGSSRGKSFSQAVSPYPRVVAGPELRTVNDLYVSGQAAKRTGDLATALQLFSAGLDLFPGHFKCLFNRAFVLERVGRCEEALSDYSTAIELEPRNPYTYYNRGILQDKLGKTEAAVTDFTAAINLEDRPEFRHNRAQLYKKQGQIPRALEDFTRTLELEKGHLKTHANRGQCFELMGRPLDALKDYETAICLHGDVDACKFWLALIQTQTLFSAAMKELAKRNAPKAALTYIQGLNTEGQGLHAQAVKYYSESITEKEGESEFWLARSRCRFALEQYEAALSDCMIAESKGAKVHYSRALIYTQLEMYEKAVQDLRQTPPSEQVSLALGYALSKSDRHEEAIVCYSSVLEQHPDNIQALHNRGSSFQQLQKYAEVGIM